MAPPKILPAYLLIMDYDVLIVNLRTWYVKTVSTYENRWPSQAEPHSLTTKPHGSCPRQNQPAFLSQLARLSHDSLNTTVVGISPCSSLWPYLLVASLDLPSLARAWVLLTQGKVPQDLNGLLLVHPDDFHVFAPRTKGQQWPVTGLKGSPKAWTAARKSQENEICMKHSHKHGMWCVHVYIYYVWIYVYIVNKHVYS